MNLTVRYTHNDPLVPVFCATPNEGRVIHRFFDSSPLSPSGRYLGLTRFPFEDRSPGPGDVAEIVLVDVESGAERVVASTTAWGSQLGAQVQWGASDSELLFNDMDMAEWQPYGVSYNVESGERRELDGSIYHVSLNGRLAVAPCLLRTGRTQLGYGVMVPPEKMSGNRGAPADDGIFVTDIVSGCSRMLVSLKDIVDQLPRLQTPAYDPGDFYAFHTKWSPDENRLLIVLRWAPRGRRRWLRKPKPAEKSTMHKFVITVAADGSDAKIAVSDDVWARGGHHPAWHPDSRHVTMNLNVSDNGLRFVSVDLDGAEMRELHPTAPGSGHPSLHPNGRFLVSDAYPNEPVAFGDGTVPIRLIDLETGEERMIARIQSRPAYVGSRKEMRLDAHPAWDRSGNFVIFNGCPDGTRRVYVADVRDLVI